MMAADPAAPAMQRARGAAHVALAVARAAAPGADTRPAGRGARLVDLAQAGSAKAMLPRVHGDRPEVVFLNTSGGLTGGDLIRFSLDLGAGAAAVAATQTAERAYASAAGHARMDIELTLGAGAVLDWLPQETILFEGSALRRATRVRMADDARLVLAEMVVLGRAAMGETLARANLRDRREVRRGGRLCLVDALHLEDAALDNGVPGAHPALWGGARATATLVLVAPGAEAVLDAVRAVLAGLPDVEAAASGWDGRCVVRMLAADALPLKRAAAAVLEVMRGGRALPRVWQI
jgi:urease accessory protein